MERHASAVWQGYIQDGNGKLSTESGALSSTPYSFSTRFEEGVHGTNPEELIGAAHAGCFSMALSGELQKLKMRPESIQTRANVKLEKNQEGWSVTAVHLDVSARIPDADPSQFSKAAEAAKAGCPISRLLKAEITMSATLDSAQAERAQEVSI